VQIKHDDPLRAVVGQIDRIEQPQPCEAARNLGKVQVLVRNSPAFAAIGLAPVVRDKNEAVRHLQVPRDAALKSLDMLGAVLVSPRIGDDAEAGHDQYATPSLTWRSPAGVRPMSFRAPFMWSNH